ncbi:hypothetical protein [Sphingomonas oryzagri]
MTDDALTTAPLAHPGEVIRLRRGSDAENMAALPRTKKRLKARTPDPSDEDEPPPRPRRRTTARKVAPETEPESSAPRLTASPEPDAPPKPARPARSKRPSRAQLDKAEAALADADAKHRETVDALRARERELQRERRGLERKHDADTKRLESHIAKARDAYSEALRAWRG